MIFFKIILIIMKNIYAKKIIKNNYLIFFFFLTNLTFNVSIIKVQVYTQPFYMCGN